MEVFVGFFAKFFIREFFAGSSVVLRNFPRLVRGGDAVKNMWFAFIVLAAVLIAAIAAAIAAGLRAPALTVVAWSAGSFVVTLVTGLTVYDFLTKP